MTKATVFGLDHIALGERPQYGMPYPEGIATAFASSADDASGGAHTFSLIADPGFIYRLELFNWTRGEATIRTTHAITVHSTLGAKTPDGPSAYNLNWFTLGTAGDGFTVYTFGGPGGTDIEQIGRLPMGAALGGGAPGVAVQLMLLTNATNTDTITNELVIAFTYWRKEALYLPGFLSSFFESPAVPPLIRP